MPRETSAHAAITFSVGSPSGLLSSSEKNAPFTFKSPVCCLSLYLRHIQIWAVKILCRWIIFSSPLQRLKCPVVAFCSDAVKVDWSESWSVLRLLLFVIRRNRSRASWKALTNKAPHVMGPLLVITTVSLGFIGAIIKEKKKAKT